MDNFDIYNNRYKSHTDSYSYSGGIKWACSLIKDILKYLDKTDIKTIIDIGCGEGTNLFYLPIILNARKFLQ